MLKKNEIIDLCRRIANDYPVWRFVAEAYKNNEERYVVKLVHPLWSFSPGSALMNPIAGISHIEIGKIYKNIFNSSASWTHCVGHRDYYFGYEGGGIRFYDIKADRAEEKIRTAVDQGIELIGSTYDFSSEVALLESIPEDNESMSGIKYCLVRAYLGDFGYVRRYRNDDIKTKLPKKYDHIDKIMSYYGIER